MHKHWFVINTLQHRVQRCQISRFSALSGIYYVWLMLNAIFDWWYKFLCKRSDDTLSPNQVTFNNPGPPKFPKNARLHGRLSVRAPSSPWLLLRRPHNCRRVQLYIGPRYVIHIIFAIIGWTAAFTCDFTARMDGVRSVRCVCRCTVACASLLCRVLEMQKEVLSCWSGYRGSVPASRIFVLLW